MILLIQEYRADELPVVWKKKASYQTVLSCVRHSGARWEKLDVSIILVDDKKIKELNMRYRNFNRVTDILSFRYESEMGERRATGELTLSVPQMIRQAKNYRTSFNREMVRLLIHGLLHLQGYDHMRASERRVMRSFENKAMKACNAEGLC